MQYKCEPNNIGLTVSSIDEESVKGVIPPVGAHIFLDSMQKIGGFEIPKDNTPKYGKFTKRFQETVDTWKRGLAGPGMG